MPARVQTQEFNREQLLAAIPRIFDQASSSTANHKKNHVALYKIQDELAKWTEPLKKSIRIIGERKFQDAFLIHFARVIPLKKGEASGDRIVKFVGGYIKFINEKAAEKRLQGHDDEEECPEYRFTVRLLNWLQGGFLAKDKTVRYRVFFTLSETVSHLGEIDEDTYRDLRAALIDRLNDKESTVRLQVALSLAKLSTSEDPDDLNGEESMQSILLTTMAYDLSVEVRRAVLMNIPMNEDTLPIILDRSRDTDTSMRKLVYEVLSRHVIEKEDDGEGYLGVTHPRALSVAHREFIVRNGLGDREAVVRAIAANLMATWVDAAIVKDESVDIKPNELPKERIEDGVVSFLTLFDLQHGMDVAVDALLSVFKAKAEVFENIEFDDQYWGDLTPEKAFLARVFVDHCKETKDDARLEAALPVVTRIAIRIQDSYNTLFGDPDFLPSSAELDVDEQIERDNKELVMAELLKLAVNLDYSDEIGRRGMFQLVRNLLRSETLPISLMEPSLDVMRTLSATERDLIRLIVETVQELRDAAYGDDDDDEPAQETDPDASFEATQPKPKPARKPLEELTPEQRKHVDQVDLRCLQLCIGTLERVNGTFEENSTLEGVLRELILPSVQRPEAKFRELGLKCLGLCCLIARKLALLTINSFMTRMSASPTSIKIILAKSLFDILMVHENAMFKNDVNSLEGLTAFLMSNIEKEQDAAVKAIFCKGTTKLVFSGMITDVNVIKNLIKAYISPSTADNQELRQCLAYFLPAYSHSSPANQKRMREIFVHIFLDICQDRKEAQDSDEEDDIVGSLQVAAMFADWTDPQRLSSAIKARGNQDNGSADESVHLDLAQDILRTLFEKDLKVNIEKVDKRVLCQLLNKLYLPDTVDDYKICSIKLLIVNLCSRRPPKDTSCKTALAKFEAAISKKYEKQLEQFSEEEFRKFEELNELFEWLDSIIPLDDDEYIEIDPPKKGRKRRSDSIISTTTEGDSRPGSPPSRKAKGKRASKRARFSTDGDEDDDDESTPKGSPTPEAPKRTLPKRAAATKKPMEPIYISSDSDEDVDKTPAPSKKKAARVRNRDSVKEEEDHPDALLQSTANTSTSTGSEIPFDSIMDDSEDEEDEVNDLLAEE